jgi:hypothetical protein
VACRRQERFYACPLLAAGSELHGLTEACVGVLTLELLVGIHHLLTPGHCARGHLALVGLLVGLAVTGLTGVLGHLCF